MRILIVAATREEVVDLIHDLQFNVYDSLRGDRPAMQMAPNLKYDLLITGVGMVATAFALGRHLAVNNYDLVLNLGIAGSFDKNIPLGEVVQVNKDTFAELGADDGDDFLPIEALGFGQGTYQSDFRVADLGDLSTTLNIKQVTGITVNTVHGNEASIKKVVERLSPQLESMEGAACFYACEKLGLTCIQIRAVSNYVEKRNRDSWKIGLAVKNLNTFALNLVERFA